MYYKSVPTRSVFLFGISIWFMHSCSAREEQLVYSIAKSVESNSYKYIEVDSEGEYRVELHSVTGDVDLYVSDIVKRPTYDDYELKSATCGDDIVTFPASFSRPVNVGIFGHPGYEQSSYILQVYYLEPLPEEKPDVTYEDIVAEEDGQQSQYKSKSTPNLSGKRPSPPKGEEEESILWTIFVGILKILMEILV